MKQIRFKRLAVFGLLATALQWVPAGNAKVVSWVVTEAKKAVGVTGTNADFNESAGRLASTSRQQ